MGRTAVMAIVMGWSFASIICCAAEPNAEQARAIAAIKELGGRIVVDDKSSDNPVVSVDLTRAQVTEAGLKQLRSLTTLQSLNLSGAAQSKHAHGESIPDPVGIPS
jgi:hypothetical protein